MRISIGAAIVLVFATRALLAGPQVVRYQGSVQGAAGGAVPDGTCDMRFAVHNDPVQGTLLWMETDAGVEVIGGLFSATLGDGTPFGDLFHGADALWLDVAFDLNRNFAFDLSEEFAPRQRLTSVAWAFDAERLQGMAASQFSVA